MKMQTNTCNNCECKNRITNKYCTDCGYELPKIEVQPVVDLEAKPKKKNQWASLLVVAIIVAVATFSANYVPKLLSSFTSVETKLSATANEVNKQCPMMVDADTRMDNIVPMPNRTMQYNYTLINMEVGDIDTTSVKSIIEPYIISTIKTSPEMEVLRKEKINFRYYYRDMNGNYVCSISVPYERYK